MCVIKEKMFSRSEMTHINLVQCNVTLVVHWRCDIGICASLTCRRVTFGLLTSALITSLIVVGRCLIQSIISRWTIAAVVSRLLGKLTGTWIRCGHLLEIWNAKLANVCAWVSTKRFLQSRFVEIAEIHLASHLFHRSTHKEEDSSAAGSIQFAAIEQDLSCCQFEWNDHRRPSLDKLRKLSWRRQFHHCEHLRQDLSAVDTHNIQSSVSFAVVPIAYPRSEDRAAVGRKPVECRNQQVEYFGRHC